jgi:hypothetical protein
MGRKSKKTQGPMSRRSVSPGYSPKPENAIIIES